jgi:hypothetical protein
LKKLVVIRLHTLLYIFLFLIFYTSELLPNIFGVAGTYNQRLRTNNPTQTSWPKLVGVEGTYNQCLRTNNLTKKSWHDELVGLTAEEAKRKINRPEADIQVVPQGHHVTFDYKPGRVRLYVDESNKVVHITFG